jgi:ABC-type transport system substrate-binding protein
VKYFESAADVAAAMKDGTLDAVLGDGVLAPKDLRDFQADSDFGTYMTPVLMHSVIIINTGLPNTTSIDLRETILHGVDKAAIIEKEFDGIGEVADRLFPRSAPYSDVELTPRYDHDPEKAEMLNCEVPGLKKEVATLEAATGDSAETESNALALGAFAIAFFL